MKNRCLCLLYNPNIVGAAENCPVHGVSRLKKPRILKTLGKVPSLRWKALSEPKYNMIQKKLHELAIIREILKTDDVNKRVKSLIAEFQELKRKNL